MAGISRSLRLIAVVGGDIYKIVAGVPSLVTGGAGLLDPSARVQSVEAFGRLYFVDGSNYVQYDPQTDTASVWVASAGTLPNNGGNTARLICLYRGRIVLSGVSGDDSNWFMSKVGDPDDWDYAPATPTVIDAVAGNSSDAGMCPDIVTALIPYSDDELIFGGDHSINRLSGDAQETGRIDLISNVIGVAWGRAWTKDPDGATYFFGMRGGVFRLETRGGFPQRISGEKIDDRLRDLSVSDAVVRMAWNDFEQLLHVFIHNLDGSVSESVTWDKRRQAWWVDTLANSNHRGIAIHTFDGDEPDDRAILIGGRDGHIYKLDPDATDDDGTAIDSHVLWGPIKSSSGVSIQITEISLTLADTADDVDVYLFAGASAEEAFAKAEAATPDWSATAGAGRNPSFRPMVRGYYVYAQIRQQTGSGWAFEQMRVSFIEFPQQTVF